MRPPVCCWALHGVGDLQGCPGSSARVMLGGCMVPACWHSVLGEPMTGVHYTASAAPFCPPADWSHIGNSQRLIMQSPIFMPACPQEMVPDVLPGARQCSLSRFRWR